jgi:hypothetical protein
VTAFTVRLRSSGTVEARQIRLASSTMAAANGSMYTTTIGPYEPIPSAASRPTKNRAASQRGTARLRHRAIAMSSGARYSLTKYT